MKNNIVSLTGTLCTGFEFSHRAYGENFYMVYVQVVRSSGTQDVIQVLVSERVADVTTIGSGTRVKIDGTYRTRNYTEAGKMHLVQYVFADHLRETDDPEDKNYIYLEGVICRKPVFRETPKGRKVTDALLAVNHNYHKSYYIPVLGWTRNAFYLEKLNVGDKLNLTGRIQSRIYQKMINGVLEDRSTQEISIYWIDDGSEGNEADGNTGEAS
jgi:single-stranded DNA-binding protein